MWVLENVEFIDLKDNGGLGDGSLRIFESFVIFSFKILLILLFLRICR